MRRALIIFDLTRLLSASGRSTPTGIERVEFQYANWLISQPDLHVKFAITQPNSVRLLPDSTVPAFLQRQADRWRDGANGHSAASCLNKINAFLANQQALPAEGTQTPQPSVPLKATARGRAPRALQKLARELRGSLGSDPIGPVLRRAAKAERPVIYLRASSDRLESDAPFEKLKRFRNVKMVVFCHDVIPLDFPEFVRARSVNICARQMDTIGRLADGVIVNSHYSAQRIRPYLKSADVPLAMAHIGVDQLTGSAAHSSAATDLPALKNVPYFLVVSTIEARKNHLLLLNVWRRLAATMGDATPKLIIVGKRGWEAQAPLAMLDRVQDLKQHVFEAGPIPDTALAALKKNALAVLMPSFVEGFGMPAVEALSDGTPVIASDIPAFRELVEGTAELIDPLDGPGWIEAITDYTNPKSNRRADALALARAYQPPRYEDHFERVRALFDALAGQGRDSAAHAHDGRRRFGYAGSRIAHDT